MLASQQYYCTLPTGIDIDAMSPSICQAQTPVIHQNLEYWPSNNNFTNESSVVVIIVLDSADNVRNNEMKTVGNNSMSGLFQTESQENCFDWVRDCPPIDIIVKKETDILRSDVLTLPKQTFGGENRNGPHMMIYNDPVIDQNHGEALSTDEVQTNLCTNNKHDHLKILNKKNQNIIRNSRKNIEHIVFVDKLFKDCRV